MALIPNIIPKTVNIPAMKRIAVDSVDTQLIQIKSNDNKIRDVVTCYNEGTVAIKVCFSTDDITTDYMTVEPKGAIEFGSEYFESMINHTLSLHATTVSDTSVLVVIY